MISSSNLNKLLFIVKSLVSAETKLRKWAQLIKNDFDKRRKHKQLDYLQKTPEGQELLLLNKKYGEQSRKLGQMKKNLDAMSMQITLLRSENKTISTNMEKMISMMVNFQKQQRHSTAAPKNNKDVSATFSNTESASPLSSDSPSNLSSGFGWRTCSTLSSNNTPCSLQLNHLAQTSAEQNKNKYSTTRSTHQQRRQQMPPQPNRHPTPAMDTFQTMMRSRGTAAVE